MLKYFVKLGKTTSHHFDSIVKSGVAQNVCCLLSQVLFSLMVTNMFYTIKPKCAKKKYETATV